MIVTPLSARFCARSLVMAIPIALMHAVAAQAQANATLWAHNGSIVKLVHDKDLRSFYYSDPRPGLISAGVRPGAPLFSGRSTGARYVGTAYFYNPRCGRLSYEVSGPILDNHKRVVVQGRAPRPADDCQVRGYFNDRLEFTYVRDEAESIRDVNVPKRATVTARRNGQFDGFAFEYHEEPSSTVDSLDTCILRCESAPNCSAYTFFSSRKLCRLMTRSDSALERNFDAVSGFINKSSAGSVDSISVPLQMEGGTYVVPVLINEAIALNFVVDSGADDVAIPADVVMTLMRTGTLKNSDFLGTQTYVLADGSKVPSETFRIRSLKIGNQILENVHGSVVPVQGSLLLGRSFLGRFKSWAVDNIKHLLILQ
jgi:gag-polyprotein putative aspartyl protease/PAN domain